MALAYDKLSEASNSLHNSIAPLINAKADKLMYKATNGKFSELYINGDMDMAFNSKSIDGFSERTLDISYMSGGTKLIAYVCMRIALLTFLCENTEYLPPMIFDESFSQLDEQRYCAVIGVLKSENTETDMQSIVFTSRKNDISFLKSIENCKAIRL